MKTIKSALRFILTSQLFISCCALGLTIETSLLLHQSLQGVSFYIFVFLSTLAVYNLYYYGSPQFKFAKPITLIVSPLAFITSLFLPTSKYPILVVIVILSLLYLIPARLWNIWSKYFHVQKLMILVFIWVAFTFILPIYPHSFNHEMVVYLLYRFVLMTQVCLMFLIKDETNTSLKNWSTHFSLILAILQILIAIIIFLYFDAKIGIIFSFISIVLYFIRRYFNKQIPSNIYYLFFVDGIMLLQSIFVILKCLAYHEL